MLLPLSLPLAHPACGCGSSARSRTRQHKPVTRAGLQFFTLTLARGCLRKQGCECLLMEPSIFIPHFLRACLFALLPGKDTAERSEQPEEGGGRSLPICSFIFRLLNSIIQQIGLRGKPAQAPIRYGSTARMSSVLQLPLSLMLQLFAEVPSCPGALLVCLFSGFPGCSGGPQPRLKTPLPWWCRCFSLLGLRVCSQK